MTDSEIIGSIGVGILLLAFLLNMLKVIRTDGLPYCMMNLTGGAMSCYASWLISYLPFVILEGVWALVAAVAIVRILIKSPGMNPLK